MRLMRIARDLKQEDIANALGIGRVTYTNYEGEVRFPSIEVLIKISEYFDVSLDYLVTGKDKVHSCRPQFEYIRVISKLSPGEKSLLQRIDLMEKMPYKSYNPEQYFMFRVTEPSMTSTRIHIGDMLMCKIDNKVNDNQRVVALINNKDTVLGKVFREKEAIILQPENSEYRPYIFDTSSVEGLIIAGIVLEGQYKIFDKISDARVDEDSGDETVPVSMQ